MVRCTLCHSVMHYRKTIKFPDSQTHIWCYILVVHFYYVFFMWINYSSYYMFVKLAAGNQLHAKTIFSKLKTHIDNWYSYHLKLNRYLIISLSSFRCVSHITSGQKYIWSIILHNYRGFSLHLITPLEKKHEGILKYIKSEQTRPFLSKKCAAHFYFLCVPYNVWQCDSGGLVVISVHC